MELLMQCASYSLKSVMALSVDDNNNTRPLWGLSNSKLLRVQFLSCFCGLLQSQIFIAYALFFTDVKGNLLGDDSNCLLLVRSFSIVKSLKPFTAFCHFFNMAFTKWGVASSQVLWTIPITTFVLNCRQFLSTDYNRGLSQVKASKGSAIRWKNNVVAGRKEHWSVFTQIAKFDEWPGAPFSTTLKRAILFTVGLQFLLQLSWKILTENRWISSSGITTLLF